MRSLAGSLRLRSSSTKSISVMTSSAASTAITSMAAHAVRLRKPEHEEQRGISEVARGMQIELAPLRAPPRDPLGQLVMIENVEQAHRELGGDERPEHATS